MWEFALLVLTWDAGVPPGGTKCNYCRHTILRVFTAETIELNNKPSSNLKYV
jgi:hypothetical protein